MADAAEPARILTLAGLMAEEGLSHIDLLKLDCEGAEWDILPAADLGVRVALRDRHGLTELPRPAECAALAEHWRPYRSIAIWYLWKDVDAPGKSAARPMSPAPATASERA